MEKSPDVKEFLDIKGSFRLNPTSNLLEYSAKSPENYRIFVPTKLRKTLFEIFIE